MRRKRRHPSLYLQEMSGSSVPSIMQKMKTDLSPPTYNKVDKFTGGFQALIDAFGVANYREINPGEYLSRAVILKVIPQSKVRGYVKLIS